MTILDPDGSADTYGLGPGDLGYRAAGSAFSREVLAATLGIPVDDLPALPFTPENPLIVPRTNP